MCQGLDIVPHPITSTNRRAVLDVPGNNKKKIKKIPPLNVDYAVLDCEDGMFINKQLLRVEEVLPAHVPKHG